MTATWNYWDWTNHKLEELSKDLGLPKWRVATIAMQVGIRHLYHLAATERLRKDWIASPEDQEDERVKTVALLRRPIGYVHEE